MLKIQIDFWVETAGNRNENCLVPAVCLREAIEGQKMTNEEHEN